MSKLPMNVPTAALMSLCLALAACSPRESARPRGDAGAAAAPAQPPVNEEAAKNAVDSKDASLQVAAEMSSAAKTAADQASNKVADAVITTSVNAELAKDPTLSALHIDVDTDAGRVALKGTAPDEASRERAAQLAAGVKGVVSVENQLTVQGKG
jgi:osmotically-inducible protein OsmY